MSNTITQDNREAGIAVIVVVAIMVALIMVTTALLATVRRSQVSATAYFQKDLARLAAMSGRAVALRAIDNALSAAAGTKEKLRVIDFLKASNTGLSDNLYTSTPDPVNFSNPSTPTTAQGPAPYEKEGIVGRVYGPYTPVRPPLNLLPASASAAQKASMLYKTTAGDLTELYSSTTLGAFTRATDDVKDYWQCPSSHDAATGTTYDYPYFSYMDGDNFDKDFNRVASSADAFYVTKYAVSIQDLGGAINVCNLNGKNDYNKAYLGYILNVASGLAQYSGDIFDGFTSVTKASSYLDNLKTTAQLYTDEDVANILHCYNDDYLLTRQMISPWGKTDNAATNPVPMCVNVYTAPKRLVRGMLKNAWRMAEDQVQIYDSSPATTIPPGSPISIRLSALAESDIDTICEDLVKSRNTSGKSINSIAADMASGLTGDKQKAAQLLTLLVLGVPLDSTWNVDLATSLLIDPNTKDVAAPATPTKVTTANIRDMHLGRLVGYDSSALPGNMTVDPGTIGPGPYFRVIVRGALLNLGTGELVSTANYECVYKNNGTNSQMMYQRWYENE